MYLSSRYEGFSIAIVEALSVGTPVVSTDCPSGPAEILENGRFGLLSPVADFKKLAMNIMEILDANTVEKDKKERIQRAHDFSYQNIIPEFEDLFNEVMYRN